MILIREADPPSEVKKGENLMASTFGNVIDIEVKEVDNWYDILSLVDLVTYLIKSEHDLGNITDYYVFLSALKEAFNSVAKVLADDGKLTIITKNVKRNGSFYTLAWDLVEQLAGSEGSYNFLAIPYGAKTTLGSSHSPLAIIGSAIHYINIVCIFQSQSDSKKSDKRARNVSAKTFKANLLVSGPISWKILSCFLLTSNCPTD